MEGQEDAGWFLKPLKLSPTENTMEKRQTGVPLHVKGFKDGVLTAFAKTFEQRPPSKQMCWCLRQDIFETCRITYSRTADLYPFSECRPKAYAS